MNNKLRQDRILIATPILYLILRSRNIIRMNPDMMVFILEIVHIIARIGGYVINLDEYKLVGTH